MFLISNISLLFPFSLVPVFCMLFYFFSWLRPPLMTLFCAFPAQSSSRQISNPCIPCLVFTIYVALFCCGKLNTLPRNCAVVTLTLRATEVALQIYLQISSISPTPHDWSPFGCFSQLFINLAMRRCWYCYGSGFQPN